MISYARALRKILIQSYNDNSVVGSIYSIHIRLSIRRSVEEALIKKQLC